MLLLRHADICSFVKLFTMHRVAFDITRKSQFLGVCMSVLYSIVQVDATDQKPRTVRSSQCLCVSISHILSSVTANTV